MTFFDHEPVSTAAFSNIWWGSRLLDDSKRNGITADFGGLVSLTALTQVTITGRAYVELWSDRHCPALDSSMPNHFEGTDPIEICKAIVGTPENNFRPTITPGEASRVKQLLGVDDVNKALDRENGARFLLSIIGEIAFQQQWNAYFILEGSPFQDSERALFTDLFSGAQPANDYRIYARTGLTYKF
jgi:hypothetical protein